MDSIRNKLAAILADMPLVQMAQGRADYGNWGRENVLKALMARGQPFQNTPEANQEAMDVAMNVGPMMMGKIVYHGSPHKFDKFDASKIGTGEGAQAYGHGVYLADAEKVAQEYQNLRPIVDPTDTGFIQARSAFSISKGDPAKALAYLDKQEQITKGASEFLMDKGASSLADIDKARGLIKSGALGTGNLYKADLPDEWIPKMLDWDKPLSQQSKEVQQSLAPARKWLSEMPGFTEQARASFSKGTATAKDLHNALVGELSKSGDKINASAASEYLQSVGIPGIRYLDGGSRGKGKGSYNYVVFPGLEDQVKILERNGEPINALADAMARRLSK